MSFGDFNEIVISFDDYILINYKAHQLMLMILNVVCTLS